MKATAKASARVDLGGGTLDLWPLYLLHPGSVTVNFAMGLDAVAEAEEIPGRRVEVLAADLDAREEAEAPALLAGDGPLALLVRLLRHLRPEGGLRLRTSSASPPGAGLGASSALSVAVVAALDALAGRERDTGETVAVARDCETQALGFPAGSQDYYPAVLGGALALHWEVGGCRVERLEVDASLIESRIALAYTGVPHHSGLNNWAVYRARLERDREVRDHLEGVRDAGAGMHRALRDGDWGGVATALAADWDHRRRLGDHISTEQIEGLIGAAAGAGALAGKVCGAGGGGCVAFICEEGRKAAVEEVFPTHGARALPVRLAGPLRVERA